MTSSLSQRHLGYYHRFISNFSHIAEPMFNLLRKGDQFTWSERQQTAFDILKNKLAPAPVLALPCDDAQTILDFDALDTGLGAVLSQELNGEERPISEVPQDFDRDRADKSAILCIRVHCPT